MNWTSLTESSRVMRIVRYVTAGNPVAKAFERLVARVPMFGVDLQRAERACDDDGAMAVIENSAIVRAALRGLAVADRMWRGSASARATSAVRGRLAAVDLAERVRMGAVVLLTALIVHLLMSRLAPFEPDAGRATPVAIGSVLLAVIAAARGVAAAWVDWSNRRTAGNESERG